MIFSPVTNLMHHPLDRHLVPLQKLLCQHKKQFYWMQIIFLSGTKCLWLSQYVDTYIFCLAQKIWTCKRTRQKSVMNAKRIWQPMRVKVLSVLFMKQTLTKAGIPLTCVTIIKQVAVFWSSKQRSSVFSSVNTKIKIVKIVFNIFPTYSFDQKSFSRWQ